MSSEPHGRPPGSGRTAETDPLGALIHDAASLAASGNRQVLGIAGAPGSGKSTLAEHLATALGPDRAVFVPMDGFHLAGSVLDERGLQDVKGAIETFDDAGFAHLLQRIRDQQPPETIYAPRFDRHLEEPIAGAIPIYASVPLVITEGNYLLSEQGQWPKAHACVTETWFLQPDESTRRKRLIRRHQAYGKTSEEARRWALGPDERNAALIQSTAAKADRIIRLVPDIQP